MLAAIILSASYDECDRSMIILTPASVKKSTSACTAATVSVIVMLSPGLDKSTTSSVTTPIKPIFLLFFNKVVDLSNLPLSSGSKSTLAFAKRTGKFTASINALRVSGPSSNSWFPTVIPSYPSLFIISAATFPLYRL